MNNINVTQIQPRKNGTYIQYNIALKPTDHVINGSFTATNDESNEAFNSSGAWNGFKQLIINRIINDTKNMDK